MYTKLASAGAAALLAITIATAPVPAAPTILVRNTTQPADQVIEGCHWANTADQWEYPDQTPCRGTGEDPTTGAAGNPACANHTPAAAEQRYDTTIYRCVQETSPKV